MSPSHPANIQPSLNCGKPSSALKPRNLHFNPRTPEHNGLHGHPFYPGINAIARVLDCAPFRLHLPVVIHTSNIETEPARVPVFAVHCHHPTGNYVKNSHRLIQSHTSLSGSTVGCACHHDVMSATISDLQVSSSDTYLDHRRQSGKPTLGTLVANNL